MLILLTGCGIIDEIKEDNRKAYQKERQPAKSVDPADECGFAGQLNEYEKSQLREYYHKTDIERKRNQEKVFGGLMPK